MIRINDLFDKISEFRSRKGLFAIAVREFFDFLKDLVTKVQEVMNGGAISLIYQADVATYDDLALVYPDAVKGWAAKVSNETDANGNVYIYQFDGTTWNRTPFTTFPQDVASKSDVDNWNQGAW